MRLTRIVPTAKFAISHVYCCISSFSSCHVTLIWPELSSTVIPKRFQVFVFKWWWLASAEQTWLYNSNTDSLYRFWRLTRLFARENWTAWTMGAQFVKTISKGNHECWAFPCYRYLPNLTVCDWWHSPSSALLLSLFQGNGVKAFDTAAIEDDSETKTASNGTLLGNINRYIYTATLVLHLMVTVCLHACFESVLTERYVFFCCDITV